MESGDGSPSPTRVHFTEDQPASETKIRRKVELTQRYDRKEIQRRLEVENWMDEKLKELYQCEVSCFKIVCILTYVVAVHRYRDMMKHVYISIAVAMPLIPFLVAKKMQKYISVLILLARSGSFSMFSEINYKNDRNYSICLVRVVL